MAINKTTKNPKKVIFSLMAGTLLLPPPLKGPAITKRFFCCFPKEIQYIKR